MDERDRISPHDDVTQLGVDSATSASLGQSSRSANLEAILEIGTVLGQRYEILEMLGLGGMGAVYKARDLELDRLIALKVIRPDIASHPEALSRFRQELLTARQVTHKNVVRIFDIGEANGVKFITMEYVAGKDLRSLLADRGKLPVPQTLAIVRQICGALAAAHAEGIIHRDLKPGNVMQDEQGRIVVMDFGLARPLEDTAKMTQSGAMLGTFEYMSPEQAMAGKLDARSDLFTIGIIFYELLTGNTPYRADSAVASLVKRTQERAIPAYELDATIPKPVSDIVSRCLERDVAQRFQSAQEIIDAIDEYEGKRPPSSLSIPAPRVTKRSFLGIGISAALLVAIAVGVTFFLKSRNKPAVRMGKPISVLVGDFANQTGDSVFNGTVEPMFNLALEGASFINAFDRNQARKLAKTVANGADNLEEEPARLVAMSQEISTVITGELSKNGNGYRIRAKAIDAVSGKTLTDAEVTAGSKDEVLSAIPKLAVPIRNALGDTTPASAQFEEVAGGFTAASLEAVHENALGVEQQFAGKFEEAFQSFQKATQIDPKFARAYTGMAAMAQNLGRTQDAEKYMKLAMEHVDRMTERERYRNRGLYYLSNGDWQKCVEEYNQLVSKYPADRVGQNNLATCYTQLRNAPKALEAAKTAVEIVPKGVGQRLNLSFISSFAGDFAGGEKEARTALEMNPAALQGFLVLAEAQLGLGQVDKAAENYKKLQQSGPVGASIAAAGLADLAGYEGNFSEAARILEESANADLNAKSADNAARKFAALSNIELMRGNSTAAIAAANKALASSQSAQVRFLAARAYVGAGELAKAQKLASEMSHELTNEPQAYGKIIDGMIALRKKDANEAIKLMTAGNNLLDTWIGRFELGRAYLDAGAFPEADSEFERCAKRRGEAIELFMDNVPTYAYFPPVSYYQGRVREGMKSEGFAEFYKTYLAIRGKSSEDPLVADVQRRIGH